LARSVGYKKDLRLSKKHNYSGYSNFNIKSFIGVNGDCYDRYLIRMLEMGESLNIINLVSNYLLNNKLNKNLVYQQLFNKNFNFKNKNYSYMEDLIEHFIQ
jgi:NADH:ubiquinone oxidoreductase subunit D